MCTCGIDIATQQASAGDAQQRLRRAGDRPNGRVDDAARSAPRAAGRELAASAVDGGGRRLHSSASADSDSAQKTPMPI